MIQIRLIEDARAAAALEQDWRDLLAHAASAEPVSTPTWLLAWWREFGDTDGRKMKLVVFEENGKLVGLAPLYSRSAMHRGAIPSRSLELFGTGEDEKDETCSDYVGIVAAKGSERAIAEALAQALVDGKIGAWDELLLPAMSSDDPMVGALREALATRGVRVLVTESGRCPYIALPKSWDEYLKALDGSNRYVVSRSIRELEKWAGKDGYALVRATDAATLEEGRRILHSLHGERWSGEGESGVFASDRFTRFHDEVMPKLLAEKDGRLDLMWLTVKGEPVAAVYNIVFGNKVYFYQSGRKLEVPKQAKPGIAIHALAIQRSIAEGHREYDFLNGQSQYKRQLATHSRPLVTLRAVAPTLRARAVDAAKSVTEEAIARLREARAKNKPKAAVETA